MKLCMSTSCKSENSGCGRVGLCTSWAREESKPLGHVHEDSALRTAAVAASMLKPSMGTGVQISHNLDLVSTC